MRDMNYNCGFIAILFSAIAREVFAKPSFLSYHGDKDDKMHNSVIKMEQRKLWFENYAAIAADDFQQLMNQYDKHFELSRISDSAFQKYQIDLMCDSCKVIFFMLQELLAQQKSQDEIAKILTEACIKLKIQHERVCQGIIQMFKVNICQCTSCYITGGIA